MDLRNEYEFLVQFEEDERIYPVKVITSDSGNIGEFYKGGIIIDDPNPSTDIDWNNERIREGFDYLLSKINPARLKEEIKDGLKK